MRATWCISSLAHTNNVRLVLKHTADELSCDKCARFLILNEKETLCYRALLKVFAQAHGSRAVLSFTPLWWWLGDDGTSCFPSGFASQGSQPTDTNNVRLVAKVSAAELTWGFHLKSRRQKRVLLLQERPRRLRTNPWTSGYTTLATCVGTVLPYLSENDKFHNAQRSLVETKRLRQSFCRGRTPSGESLLLHKIVFAKYCCKKKPMALEHRETPHLQKGKQ